MDHIIQISSSFQCFIGSLSAGMGRVVQQLSEIDLHGMKRGHYSQRIFLCMCTIFRPGFNKDPYTCPNQSYCLPLPNQLLVFGQITMRRLPKWFWTAYGLWKVSMCVWMYICICICICIYVYVSVYMYLCSVTQSCPTLCNPINCSPPGSSVHGILL